MPYPFSYGLLSRRTEPVTGRPNRGRRQGVKAGRRAARANRR